MNISPIVLFVYNRPNLVAKVIRNLKKNSLSKKSDLYIFSDGAKKNEFDIINVLKVRTYIKKLKGFKKINIIERKRNLGLYENITSGLNFIFKKKKSAIILEDDILVSKYFLEYMNDALKFYQNNNDVGTICGNLPFLNKSLPDTYFLYYQDCWGWATWRRSWKLYSHNSYSLLKNINQNNLKKKFNLDDNYKFSNYLKENIIKKRSWATNWYASLFIKKKFNLFPGYQMCKNIGFGTMSTNSKMEFDSFDLSSEKIKIKKIDLQESILGYKELVKFYSKNAKNLKLDIISLEL